MIAGTETDVPMSNTGGPTECPPSDMYRTSMRIHAFEACANLLKALEEGSEMTFILRSDALSAPSSELAIRQRLGPFGDLVFKSGPTNIIPLLEKKFNNPLSTLPYTAPQPHPGNDHRTFAYQAPDMKDPKMDNRAIPLLLAPKFFDAADPYIIYLMFDTNLHSRVHRQLLDLVKRLGPKIRLVSLSTVAKELAAGRGGQARSASLQSFIRSGRSKSYGPNQLQVRPATFIDASAPVSKVVLSGDLRIRTEIAIALKLAIQANPGRRVVFLFGTFDVGNHSLCSAIEPGAARLLLPLFDIRDRKNFLQVVYNVLFPYLGPSQ